MIAVWFWKKKKKEEYFIGYSVYNRLYGREDVFVCVMSMKLYVV